MSAATPTERIKYIGGLLSVSYRDHELDLSAIARELLPYAKLGAMVTDKYREYAGDIDGDWFEDAAVECGVLRWVEVAEPCDPENCWCLEYHGSDGFPTKCLRLAAAEKVNADE